MYQIIKIGFGYMYFLIGLAKINPVVYDIHPWILNID